MATDSKNAPTFRAPLVDVAAVKAFLASHPTFLADHPELLQALAPPSAKRGDNVLDMQHFMVERLQRDIARLKSLQGELIKVGQSNLSSQAQIHSAVLALLEARTFEHSIEVIAKDFVRHLEVDTVAIAIEAAVPTNAKRARGVRMIETGTVERLIGKREIVLRDEVEAEGLLYGRAAGAIRSDALLRLALGPLAPHGLLALGSRVPRRFHAGQGTELLCFLARVVARSIKTWLDLPG
jgi:uncharacterized protein YigA (DUF484 family)